jgi:hypothetical protein
LCFIYSEEKGKHDAHISQFKVMTRLGLCFIYSEEKGKHDAHMCQVIVLTRLGLCFIYSEEKGKHDAHMCQVIVLTRLVYLKISTKQNKYRKCIKCIPRIGINLCIKYIGNLNC